jgi:hypothetical protein
MSLAISAAKRPSIARDTASTPSFMARRNAVREISSLRTGLSFTEFAAQVAQVFVEVIGGLTGAVFDFGLVVRAEKVLLFPLVGFFADVEDLESNDVPPFGPTTIKEIAVEEFRFGPQVILGQRFGVGRQRIRSDRVPRFPIKGELRCLAQVFVKRRDRPYRRLFSRASPL